jgi:hypothetical protein
MSPRPQILVFYMGWVQLVMFENKTFIGVADPRRDGSAAGPDP